MCSIYIWYDSMIHTNDVYIYIYMYDKYIHMYDVSYIYIWYKVYDIWYHDTYKWYKWYYDTYKWCIYMIYIIYDMWYVYIYRYHVNSCNISYVSYLQLQTFLLLNSEPLASPQNPMSYSSTQQPRRPPGPRVLRTPVAPWPSPLEPQRNAKGQKGCQGTWPNSADLKMYPVYLFTFTGRQGPSTFGKVYKLGQIKKVYWVYWEACLFPLHCLCTS